MGAIGIGGKLLGGLFGKSASNQMQEQLAKAQAGLQQDETKGLANYQPYLDAGSGATRQLSDLLGTPGTGLLTPWTQQFTAPTAEQAEQTPGYQFQLKAGQDAMQNSAAAQGGLLTGRTLADLNNFAQGTAASNYQNTFNNAYTQYQSAYNTFQNNQNSNYQRLMGMSGQGLQAAGGAGNLIQGIGGDIASLYAQKGAAQAAGTMAMGNGIAGGMTDLSQLGMMGRMMNWNNGGGSEPEGYAMGTDFAPGGPAMVGEAGPELVNLPRGSQVIPNHQLPVDLGGNTNASMAAAPMGRPQPIADPQQRFPMTTGTPSGFLPGMPSGFPPGMPSGFPPGMRSEMPPGMPNGAPGMPFPGFGMNPPRRFLGALA